MYQDHLTKKGYCVYLICSYPILQLRLPSRFIKISTNYCPQFTKKTIIHQFSPIVVMIIHAIITVLENTNRIPHELIYCAAIHPDGSFRVF